MLINIPLPIDSDRLNKSDQTLSLAGMTWSDFEQFITEEYLGYKVDFFEGVITLVSPSKNHERIAEVIGETSIDFPKPMTPLVLKMSLPLPEN